MTRPVSSPVRALVVGVVAATCLATPALIVPASAEDTSSTISGVLRDATGEAVAGATVSLTEPGAVVESEVVTGPDGAFAVSATDGPEILRVWTPAQGASVPALWLAGKLIVAGDRTVDITLPAIAPVTVRAVDADGSPLSGIDIQTRSSVVYAPIAADIPASVLAYEWRGDAFRTGTDGRATIGRVVGESTTVVAVSRPTDVPYAGYEVTGPQLVDLTEAGASATVTVPRVVSFTGNLRTADGTVIDAAGVATGLSGSASIGTDPTIPGALPVEPTTLTLSTNRIPVPGEFPYQLSLAATLVPTADINRDLVLPAKTTVALSVLNDDGSPAANQTVGITLLSQVSDLLPGVPAKVELNDRSIELDADGKATLTLLPGELTVQAYSPQLSFGRATIDADGGAATVTLEPGFAAETLKTQVARTGTTATVTWNPQATSAAVRVSATPVGPTGRRLARLKTVTATGDKGQAQLRGLNTRVSYVVTVGRKRTVLDAAVPGAPTKARIMRKGTVVTVAATPTGVSRVGWTRVRCSLGSSSASRTVLGVSRVRLTMPASGALTCTVRYLNLKGQGKPTTVRG